MHTTRCRDTALLALLGGATPILLAQTEAQLPMVTVTVNKSAQTLARVPASLRVLDADELEDAGARNLADVAALTPGFTVQPMGQSGLQPPVIRGITASATSFSSSTALVVDGVATLRGQGFDDSLLGVERVEVLRGPQSTLYGRNAEAGVVSIVTRRPGNEPQATLGIDVGSRHKRALRFDLSRAVVTDTLFIGVAGEGSLQDGFVRNATTGHADDNRERHSGRFVLRWLPSARTDVSLRLSQRTHDDGASTWGQTGTARATVSSGTAGWNHTQSQSASLDIAHELDSGLHLRSITANNTHFDRVLQDMDFQPVDRMHLGRDYRFQTLSQEFRLEGKWGGSTWLAGLYVDRDDNKLNFENKTPLALTRTASTQTGHSVAAFTHWDVPLGDHWSLQAGARAERDSIRFQMANTDDKTRAWTRLTPKLAVQYQWQPRTQVYASVADGFRTGGFNTFAPESRRSYDPERLRAFELGIKGDMLTRRLRYSAAVYRMDINDMQVQQMGATPGQVFIANAATARSTGAEADVHWLLGTGWQLQAALGLNHTRLRDFQDGAQNHAGKRNPFAPDIHAHIRLRYDAPSGWFAQAQATGLSKVYVDAANTPAYRRPGYGVVNLSAGYSWGHTQLTAYVNNVGKKQYDTVGFPSSTVTIYSPPREFGLRLNWHL